MSSKLESDVCCRLQVNATKVNAGLAESNGSLLLGIWRDSLHVTCGLTACTPGSAPGPTLGNEHGKTLLFMFDRLQRRKNSHGQFCAYMVVALLRNRYKSLLEASEVVREQG